jgi:drug/metabolite transporter (DMT)-like permease
MSSVALVLVPLAVTRRLKSPRGVVRPMLIAGVGEVAAFGAYIAASDRIGVAVPAVIASQFAVIAATVGWFVLGERLGARQLTGAGAILAGVTALTILQA